MSIVALGRARSPNQQTLAIDTGSHLRLSLIMHAVRQLQDLKGRLEAQISAIQSELDTITKTIKILEREIPGASAQMSLPALAIDGTSALRHETPKAVGLSDMCRKLITTAAWVAPTDVRDGLLAAGYHNTDKHKLLASVYATLKRLAENGEFETRKEGGRTEFRKPTSERAA